MDRTERDRQKSQNLEEGTSVPLSGRQVEPVGRKSARSRDSLASLAGLESISPSAARGTAFPSAHGGVPKIDHVPAHKTALHKLESESCQVGHRTPWG